MDSRGLTLDVAVVVGAAPIAGPLDVRAELTLASVDRGALRRRERATGPSPERNG